MKLYIIFRYTNKQNKTFIIHKKLLVMKYLVLVKKLNFENIKALYVCMAAIRDNGGKSGAYQSNLAVAECSDATDVPGETR